MIDRDVQNSRVSREKTLKQTNRRNGTGYSQGDFARAIVQRVRKPS
jgi:hypothetical protein